MIRASIISVLLVVPGVFAVVPVQRSRALPGADVVESVAAFRTWYGLTAHAPTAGCTDASHRGFDFWVGEWSVRGAAGRDAGRSSIRRQLDGCAILEVFGSTGRSLSAWRSQSEEWLQTYADNTGLTLRFQGRAALDSMVLADSVRRVAGSSGIALASRMTWHRLAGGRVRQIWWLSRDAGATWPINFDGTYAPDSTRFPTAAGVAVPGTAVAGTSVSHPCRDRAEYRAMDGLLGDWSVMEAEETPYATSRIRSSLDGCLLEEHLAGRSGYERHSLIMLDRYTSTWIWASADNRGVVERFVARALPGAPIHFENELRGGRHFCLAMPARADVVFRPLCDGASPAATGVRYRKVQAAEGVTRRADFYDRVRGRWSGAGTLAGRPMTATYNWTQVATGAQMTVALFAPGVTNAEFEGTLLLPIANPTGRWTDTQGANYAVERITLSSDSLTTAWGPDTARGRSVYRLVGADTLEVRDYLVNASTGGVRLFGHYMTRRVTGDGAR